MWRNNLNDCFKGFPFTLSLMNFPRVWQVQADTVAMNTSKECYLHIEFENSTNFLISYQHTFHLRIGSSSVSWCSKIAQQWCFFHCSNQTFLPLVHLTISHLSLNASFTDSDHTHYTHIISLKKLWKYSSLSAL